MDNCTLSFSSTRSKQRGDVFYTSAREKPAQKRNMDFPTYTPNQNLLHLKNWPQKNRFGFSSSMEKSERLSRLSKMEDRIEQDVTQNLRGDAETGTAAERTRLPCSQHVHVNYHNRTWRSILRIALTKIGSNKMPHKQGAEKLKLTQKSVERCYLVRTLTESWCLPWYISIQNTTNGRNYSILVPSYSCAYEKLRNLSSTLTFHTNLKGKVYTCSKLAPEFALDSKFR